MSLVARHLREHPRALGVLAVLCLAWACAVRTGTSVHTYFGTIGGPRPTTVRADVVTFRHGVSDWVRLGRADWSAVSAGGPVPVTPELEAALVSQVPAGKLRLGWDVRWERLPVSLLAGAALWALSACWWVILRQPARGTAARRALRVLGLSLWPTALALPAAHGVWRHLGRPVQVAPTLLHAEAMLDGTVVLVCIGLVLALTPRASGAPCSSSSDDPSASGGATERARGPNDHSPE